MSIPLVVAFCFLLISVNAAAAPPSIHQEVFMREISIYIKVLFGGIGGDRQPAA